ncbi:MAG TPA: prepilin-type N-terminal cleavage/methylation domain-containing protein [Opitutaceae bacterium]|nr:prepilin-type N-terminal cleavage/methylation domain-containing protein [Opitutaceae bacterium]
MTPRRGFVLAELLVALVIAAVIGMALTQLVISQSRFVALQGGIMQARGGARAALNVLSNDLRMVSDGGLVAATTESVTVRVPYAFGVVCGQSGGATIVSLLPADSAAYATASISGYAWRDTTTAYVFTEPATVANADVPLTNCTGATPPITTLTSTSWAARAVALAPNDIRTATGTVVYLYQLVRYAFAPSSQLPGRVGLWRTVLASGQRDELVAPFDSTAGFQFLVGTGLNYLTAPPSDLTTVRGLRLLLVASSEQPPEGRTRPTIFTITTNVLFQNHP